MGSQVPEFGSEPVEPSFTTPTNADEAGTGATAEEIPAEPVDPSLIEVEPAADTDTTVPTDDDAELSAESDGIELGSDVSAE